MCNACPHPQQWQIHATRLGEQVSYKPQLMQQVLLERDCLGDASRDAIQSQTVMTTFW
jgi:hypothetical protein